MLSMFHNPELQRIYEESKPIFKEHLSNINFINNDIKILEGVFKNLGKYFEFNCDGACLYYDPQNRRLWISTSCGLERPFIEAPLRIRIKYAHMMENLFKLIKE